MYIRYWYKHIYRCVRLWLDVFEWFRVSLLWIAHHLAQVGFHHRDVLEKLPSRYEMPTVATPECRPRYLSCSPVLAQPSWSTAPNPTGWSTALAPPITTTPSARAQAPQRTAPLRFRFSPWPWRRSDRWGTWCIAPGKPPKSQCPWDRRGGEFSVSMG